MNDRDDSNNNGNSDSNNDARKYDSDYINGLTRRIIGGAINVHRALGPGLLEATYEACLAAELRQLGLHVERQVPMPVRYRGTRLEVGYRIDVLVEKLVVVELKVAEAIAPVHVSQVLTYLRLGGIGAGLIFNFNVDALAAGGIKRVVLGGTVRRPSETLAGGPAASGQIATENSVEAADKPEANPRPG